ncbi:hypothetical protein FNF27_04389 [Cafeteria roenbergensis]|uniref:OTU domain-containing protein n=2 Tax=Cafeteria roenbergensis TaxID=33653 RepID=A0A5A8EA69_CAFRO|nr:hypothetical protein FNF27_04389 [Cafeteria roenbergensis]
MGSTPSAPCSGDRAVPAPGSQYDAHRGQGRPTSAATRVARPAAPAPAHAPYEQEDPPLVLEVGQLVDLITVRSSPHWLPAIVTKVRDGGWRVRVTAFEIRSRGGYKYYDLDLGSSNDCNCMSPLGTYTGMTEDDIAASGGLEAIAAIRNGVDVPSRAPAPAPAPELTEEERRRLARQAAQGIGTGTGNKLIDGDGVPGTADPKSPKPAMPHPMTKPSSPDTNPLNRTEAAARAEAERLAASPPAVGDFLDVRCPDYRWRAGQVTSVQFSPDPATPERAVITCEITCMTGSSEEPTSVQFIHSAQIGSLDFAPHSQYSDVTIHEYSAGQIVDCLDVFTNTQGAVRSMWRPAEVRATTNDSVLIHFLNWDAKWDAWLNMHCDAHRLAPVGSRTDDETQQQRLSRQLDQEFVDAMLSNGLRVVRVATDGSCLFRAIAHQIYGTPDMHAKVRADVIQHMRNHADRFALVAAAVEDAPAPPGHPEGSAEHMEGSDSGAAAAAAAATAAAAQAGVDASLIGPAAAPETPPAKLGAEIATSSSSTAAAAGGTAASTASVLAGESADSLAIDPALARYLERMQAASAWGGDPEVMAAEELFDREIVLYSSDDFERNGAITTMSRMDHPALSLPSGRDPIRIAYHGSKHYNSVELVAEEPLAVRKGLGSAGCGGILAAKRASAFGVSGGAVSPMNKLVMSPSTSVSAAGTPSVTSGAAAAAAKPTDAALQCADDKSAAAPVSAEHSPAPGGSEAAAGFSAGGL